MVIKKTLMRVGEQFIQVSEQNSFDLQKTVLAQVRDLFREEGSFIAFEQMSRKAGFYAQANIEKMHDCGEFSFLPYD